MDAVVDIETAYQQTLHRVPKRSITSHNTVDLSRCSSGLPYTIDFTAMEQTRHGYGTKRKIRRELIPKNKSLQALLQTASCAGNALFMSPLVSSSTPSVLPNSTAVGKKSKSSKSHSSPSVNSFNFSSGVGPATGMLCTKGHIRSGNTVTSVRGNTAGAAVSSSTGPSESKQGTRKGGKNSSSPPLVTGMCTHTMMCSVE